MRVGLAATDLASVASSARPPSARSVQLEPLGSATGSAAPGAAEGAAIWLAVPKRRPIERVLVSPNSCGSRDCGLGDEPATAPADPRLEAGERERLALRGGVEDRRLRALQLQVQQRAQKLDALSEQVSELQRVGIRLLRAGPAGAAAKAAGRRSGPDADDERRTPQLSIWRSCSVGVLGSPVAPDEEFVPMGPPWPSGFRYLSPSASAPCRRPRPEGSPQQGAGGGAAQAKDVRSYLRRRQTPEKKGAVLLSTLHSLRRPTTQLQLQTDAACAEEDADSMLLTVILSDTTDTPEQLRGRSQGLLANQRTVLDSGGACHATVHLSRRTKAVMDRKAELLAILRARAEAHEGFVKRRAELLEAVFAGRPASAVIGGAAGLRQLLKEVVQDGDPREVKRGNFEFFVRSLQLPPQHKIVLRARQSVEGGAEECCSCAVEMLEAREEAAPDATLRDLAGAADEAVAVLIDLGVSARHSAVQEMQERIRGMRARYVLHLAMEAQQKEEERLSGSIGGGKAAMESAFALGGAIQEALRLGVPEKAEEMASARVIMFALRAAAVLQLAQNHRASDEAKPRNSAAVTNSAAIRAECQEAVSFGVAPTDPALVEARAIANDLRAVKALRVAQSERQEDEGVFQRGEYKSGDATAAADRLEVEIQDALKAFVPADHPDIREAQAIQKFLREQEGLRKRQRYADANKKNKQQ